MRELAKLLPAVSSGGFLVGVSACGCGHCPLCYGYLAGASALAVYISAKKFLGGNKNEKPDNPESSSV